MKTTFSALAIGLALAFASASSWAVSSATIAQTGTGNCAFADQGDTADSFGVQTAQITQTGNDNRAGDSLARTGGIVQLNNGDVEAAISQAGNASSASIRLAEGARTIAGVTQVGDNNTGISIQDGAVESIIRICHSPRRQQQ